ncbi:MAG: DapH/DapD/GlmU-related protein [Candidatus Nanoarchaeia archaeon]|nr:DapH/DapD/GlmU-related protein [Candidatus Nanoarchaeia archaeon]
MKEHKDTREMNGIGLFKKAMIGIAMFCPFSFVKRSIYKLLGAKIGHNVYFGPQSVIISNNYKKIRIGDNVFFSFGVAITTEDLVIGDNTHIGYQALMTGKIKIGKNCNINNRAFIEAYYAPIIIEDNVTIAGSVMISSHDGSFMNVLGKEMIAKQIILKKQCFIGNNAVILPGITVNEKAIVGAGAVVTKDVEKRTIVVGVPAKPIRKI